MTRPPMVHYSKRMNKKALPIQIETIRDWIAKNGPVRSARIAGLSKAALMRARLPEWNPSYETLNKILTAMDKDEVA